MEYLDKNAMEQVYKTISAEYSSEGSVSSKINGYLGQYGIV
jgi:hypothetical protein